MGPAAAEAVFAARVLRGDGTDGSPVLGLLVGGPLGDAEEWGAPRRVFTLQFDASVGRWRGYTGGLVPWMKERLLTNAA